MAGVKGLGYIVLGLFFLGKVGAYECGSIGEIEFLSNALVIWTIAMLFNIPAVIGRAKKCKR